MYDRQAWTPNIHALKACTHGRDHRLPQAVAYNAITKSIA